MSTPPFVIAAFLITLLTFTLTTVISNGQFINLKGFKPKPDTPSDDIEYLQLQFLKKMHTQDEDMKLAENCLYDQFWLTDPNDFCYVIAQSDDNWQYSERVRKLRHLFQSLIDRDHEDQKWVEDCFQNHQKDNYGDCFGITWGEERLAKQRVKSHREVRLKKIWANLVGCEERCRNHPWEDYGDCQ